ncbi:MAG: transposase family protein [Fervidobacterium sp.]
MSVLDNKFFHDLIGLSLADFYNLHSKIELNINNKTLNLEEKSSYRGRKRSLDSVGQLLLFLMWFRQYLSVRILSWIFNISEATVQIYLDATLDMLYNMFKSTIKLPNKTERLKNSRIFGKFPITIVIDGSEQQVKLCSKTAIEKATYSGKKKKHTFTLMLACSPKGHIYYLSPTYNGSKNDIIVYEFSENWIHDKIDSDEGISADLAYSSIVKYHKLTFIPKSQRNMEDEENEEEGELKSIRVIVENVFRRIKEWKICKDKLRVPLINLEETQLKHHKIWVVAAFFVNSYHKGTNK